MKCAVCGRPALRIARWEPERCWVHLSDLDQRTIAEKLAAPKLRDPQLDDADLSGIVFQDSRIFEGSFTAAQLRGASLRNLRFYGTDLSGVDFAGARLEDVEFHGIQGERIDLSRAYLINCTFRQYNETAGCELRQATFGRATLQGVHFESKTSLEEATFGAASLMRVSFVNCVGRNSDLQNLRCDDVFFEGGDFGRSFFADSVFVCGETALFAGVKLEGSDYRRISIVSGSADQSDGEIEAFSACNLRNCDFEAAQLDRCRLRDCLAISCSFHNAGLREAHFSTMDLTSAVFAGADLGRIRFEGDSHGPDTMLILDAARFEGAILRGATFINVRSVSSTFTAARFEAENGRRCLIKDCEFRQGVFQQVGFRDTDFEGRVDFGDTSLSGSSFNRCVLDHTVFRDANLRSVEFADIQYYADLEYSGRREVDLTGADLSDSDLQEVDIMGCCFKKAILNNVNLRAARLSGANFDEARLSLCDLSGVKEATRVSFRGARIVDCSLDEAQFRNCSFAGASLEGSATVRPGLTVRDARYQKWQVDEAGRYQVGRRAIFTGCDFAAANLSNCSLIGADFSGSVFAGAVLKAADLRDSQLVPLGCDGDKGREVDATLADFGGAILGYEPERTGGETTEDTDVLLLRPAQFRSAALRGLRASGASFQGALLHGCDLSGARLDRARLDNCDLTAAKLTDVTFEGANLVGVAGFTRVMGLADSERPPNFRYAFIQATQGFSVGTEEWRIFQQWINRPPPRSEDDKRSLSAPRAAAAGCARARSTRDSSAEPEEAGEAGEAHRLSWVAWKNNFQSLGLYREQSECFREEQIARGWEKLHRYKGSSFSHPAIFATLLFVSLAVSGGAYATLMKLLGPVSGFWAGIAVLIASALGLWRLSRKEAARGIVKRAGLLLVDILYGFGEKPWKVMGNGIGTVVAFAMLFWLTVLANGSLEHLGHICVAKSRHVEAVEGECSDPSFPGEYIYVSAVTFTTLGQVDYDLNGYARFLAAAESLVGLIMAALLIHAIARRTAGR